MYNGNVLRGTTGGETKSVTCDLGIVEGKESGRRGRFVFYLSRHRK